jgi:sec-independent protein translocase protein TatB
MFEVGFTEIVLILGLALLVLGPEKLPGLAEKVGRWTGRARAMARQLRTQLEQEVTLDEMTKSRPMQAPPPASPTPSTDTAASTTAPVESVQPETQTETQAEPSAVSDQPHNASGLDLQTMVSGMEPPPQSSAETPATKAVP